MSSAGRSGDERRGNGSEAGDDALGLAARLRAIARLLPEGATVSLDARALEVLARPEANDLDSAGAGPDLTTSEAAERLRLSENRIRALIGEKKLAAYRIAGRGGWRITLAALEAFRRAGAPEPPLATGPADRVDIGRWRRVRRRSTEEEG